MAYFKEEDYLKLANAAAIDLVDNRVPLNDSITKLAQQFDLSQDQIMRLCEATNNTTFNHIFKTKTASDDRLVEFDIADPKAVLRHQIKEASVQDDMGNASIAELYELPDQMGQVRSPYMDHFTEKVAATEEAIRVRVTSKGGDLQIFSVGSSLWEMPSGVAKEGENRKDAASRILLSKTGLRTLPTQLEYAGMQTFRGKMYHTFEVDTDKLQRANYPTDEKGNKPRIEYHKEAGFELRPLSKPNPEADLRTLEKTAAYLRHESLAASMEYQDTIVKLAHMFKRLYKDQSFEAFEKQAAAFFGEPSAEALTQIRTILHKPAMTYNWVQLEKTAGFIETVTEEFNLLRNALDLKVKLSSHAKAQRLLETQIKSLNTELRAS
jgi:ADP-ribose pyrophosphatase YjhB (NUDIX family)